MFISFKITSPNNRLAAKKPREDVASCFEPAGCLSEIF